MSLDKKTFLQIMEKLLVLPNSKSFEQIPEVYFEIAKDLTTKELSQITHQILLNEEFFPLPSRFYRYVMNKINEKKKSFLFYCENCEKYYQLSEDNDEINLSELKCLSCNQKMKLIGKIK